MTDASPRAPFGRLAARLLLALALALALASPALAQPPVWRIRAGAATVVLFGSFHLLPSGLDWRPPALDEALGKARTLWFELPLTAASDNAAAAAYEKHGRLPQGAALTAMMSQAEADKLRRVAAKLNCSMEALETMRPWRADATISIAADVQSGADAFHGVEDQIQALAPPTVPRRAFETAEQQVAFLSGAPLGDQIAALEWTLGQVEDDPGSYQRMLDAWMAGDLAGLERDASEPLRRVAPALYERLIVERNRRWARVIRRRILKRAGLTVIVVGVGHLIGADGVPALLRRQGVTVEGP